MVSQKEITDLIKDYWKQPSNRCFIIGLFSLVVFVSGYKLYVRHNKSQQMQAQKDFFTDISMYNKAKGAKSKSDNKDVLNVEVTLEDVDAAFKNSASQNSGSKVEPFFKAYESVVQSELGNDKIARDIWEGVAESLSASDSSRISDLYKIKLALMNIDQGIKNGLEQLKTLANDTQNKFQDLANFYLGEYYYSQGDFVKAKESFDKVVHLNPDSDWAKMVKSKMEG